jgi:HSP20 family protein
VLWSDLERFGSFSDPWREFERVSHQLTRGDGLGSSPAEFPAVNVWTTGDHVVVTTEIPGIDPKSLDISVVNNTLTLHGSRQPDELKEGETYHRRERWNGQFRRTLELPFPVEAGKVEARFTRGVLYISLPRAEADKPRKVVVKAEQA